MDPTKIATDAVMRYMALHGDSSMYDEDGNYTIDLESFATMTSSTRLFEVNYDVSRDIMTITILKVAESYAVPKPAAGW